MKRIVNSKKDNLGRDVEFALDDQRLYNYEEAIEMIRSGEIINAEVEIDRHGYKKIKFGEKD